ncbi:MAG: radical SAM protein [Planctomycetota bacterium]
MLRIGFILAAGNDSRSYGIPLSFAYLVSVLQREWEAPFEYHITTEPYDLVDFDPDLIGIGSVTSCFWQVPEFAALFREKVPRAKLVLGGHHISALPHRLPVGVDVGVLGEGEDTFLELVRRYRPDVGWEEDTLRSIPGICYQARSGPVVTTPPRAVRANLDTLPFPVRCENPERADEAVLFTSRGCPFRCTYCSTQGHWQGYRRFSAAYVVREIEHITSLLPQVRSVYILDDLYVADRRRLREMVRLMESSGLNRRLTYHGFVRSNLVDDELCELLRRMNVSAIRFGAESGSDAVLRLMERGGKCSVATHQRAIDQAHNHGLKCGASFMFGFPGETRDDLLRTFDFIRQNADKMFVEGLYLAVPLPGAELWKWASGRGLVSETMDWRRLNLAFDNPDFDWEDFLYLNEETVPRGEFVQAVMESGILPDSISQRSEADAHGDSAAVRMNNAMVQLAADGVRRVALYGAGRHTRRLKDHLNHPPVEIVGLIDDDASLHGKHLGRFRIHHPDDVANLGVEAVILSSDEVEEQLWARRGRFDREGIVVRRLYGPTLPADTTVSFTSGAARV